MSQSTTLMRIGSQVSWDSIVCWRCEVHDHASIAN